MSPPPLPQVDHPPITSNGGDTFPDGTPSASLDQLESYSRVPDDLDLDPDFTPRPEYQTQPATLPELIFRHSGWIHQRKQVFNALQRTGAPPGRIDSFANCGSALTLRRNQQTGRYSLGCNYCKDRHCAPCAKDRSFRIFQAVQEHTRGRQILFVTLTKKHTSKPLHEQIDELYRCWNLLRRRPFWRDNCEGGAAFLEIHRSTTTACWHVHLHILAQSRWIDQSTLSRDWLAVTGDSPIVDVRKAGNDTELMRYVAKYASKPANKVIYDDADSLQEMITALRGRRLCATFGSWRGLKLKQEIPPDQQGTSLGFVSDLFRGAHAGEPTATHILASLNAEQPILFERLATVFGPQLVLLREQPP